MEASNYEILKVDEASKADTNILSDKKISSTEIYKTGKNVETFGAKSYDDLRAQHEAEMALFDLQLENAGKNKDAEKILIKARKDNLEVENQQPAVQKELTTINTLLPQTETSIQDTLVSSLTEIGKIPEDKLKEIATKLGVSATSLAGLVETCKDCTIATFDLDAVKAVGKVQFFAKEQYLKDVAEAYKNGVQYSIDRSAGTATFMTIRKILTELSKLSTTTTPSSVTNLPTSSDNNLPTSSVTNPLESSDKIQVADIKALPEDTQRKLAEELTGEADKVKSTDADLSKNKIILQNFVDYNTTKKRIDEMITENATLKASGAKAQEINDNKKVIASDKKDNAAILTQLAKDTKTDKPTLLKNFNETMAKYYEALQTKIVEVSKTTPATTIDNITTTIPPQTSNTIPLQTSNIIIPQTSNSTLKTSNSTSNTPSKAPTLSNTKKLDIKSDKVFTAINDSKIIDNYPNWKDATEDKRTEAKGIYSELKPLATDTDIIATLKKYDDLTTLKITSELFAKKIRMTKADKVEKASLQKVAQNIITRESEIITAAKAKVSTTPATVDNTTTNATPDNTSTNTTTNIDNTTSNSTPNTSNNTSNTTPDNTTPDNTTTTVDNTTTTVDNTINRATETIPIINIKEDATTTDQNTTANDTNTTDNSETKKVETGDASFTLELLKA